MRYIFEIVVMVFACACFPAVKTPVELAERYKCDPEKISDWIGAMTEYQRQPGYEPAEVVMRRGISDCKGRAQIAMETLRVCAIKASMIHLSNPNKTDDHIITVFTMSDGRRGFIDGGQSGIYPAVKSWVDIIREVGDGGWQAVFAEEENKI